MHPYTLEICLDNIYGVRVYTHIHKLCVKLTILSPADD